MRRVEGYDSYNSKRTADIYRGPEMDEYVVKFYDTRRGVDMDYADYYADSIVDARDTARDYVDKGRLPN